MVDTRPVPVQTGIGGMTPGMELQLVTAIAGLQADMKHVRETGDRTHEAVNGLTGRVSNLEVDVATLKARPALEAHPELDRTVATLVERTEAHKSMIATLQSVIDAKALSWPKLLTGVGAVVGVIVALGLYQPN